MEFRKSDVHKMNVGVAIKTYHGNIPYGEKEKYEKPFFTA